MTPAPQVPLGSLEALLSVGEIDRMTWYIRRNYSATYAKAQLARRHPDASQRTIDAVFRRAERAEFAGSMLTNAPGSTRLHMSAIPQGPAGALGVVYTVDVQYIDLQTGAPSEKTVRVRAIGSITLAEVEERADRELQEMIDRALAARSKKYPQKGITVTGHVIRSVFRG